MATTMDRLRDRWEQISPREQRLVLALSVTLVLVVIVLLGRGISDGLDQIAEDNEDTRKALSALQAYRVTQAQEAASSARNVPIPDEPIKLQSYLEDVANNVGITIPGFNPQAPVTRDGFIETATRIELRNLSILELKDFLQQVESKSKQVVVKSLNIKRHFRDKDKLNVTMNVATYANEKKVPEDGDGEQKEG